MWKTYNFEVLAEHYLPISSQHLVNLSSFALIKYLDVLSF